MLTPSFRTEPESVAAGAGGGFGAERWGEPDRYGFTARSYHLVSPCYSDSLQYSQQNIYLGSNFIANLEVVSSLNLFNQARYTYHYNYSNSPERYYPKVYLGTTQTVALGWLYDRQIYAGSDIKIPENWPINSSQKGEAISILIYY